MIRSALVIAQPSYKNWHPLTRAAEAAQKLADSLGKHSYALGHSSLLDGSDTEHAAGTIADWFGGAPQDARLVLFWTGHGCSDGGHNYLVCRNSPSYGLTAFTAIDASALGPVIANCKAEKILVILDTCYSGDGAAKIASEYASVLATRVQIPGQERHRGNCFRASA